MNTLLVMELNRRQGCLVWKGISYNVYNPMAFW